MKAHDLNSAPYSWDKGHLLQYGSRTQSLVSLKSFGLSPGWPGTL